MKIGFDAKRIFHNTSGLGNYSRDIVRVLSQHYPENNYLLYNPRPGKVDRLSLRANMHLRYPQGYLDKKFSSLWRRRLIVKQLKRDGIDLFHGLSNELPAGIASAGIPAVATVHDLIFMRYPEWYSMPDRFIHKIKVKNAVAGADKIIAISQQTKADLIHFLDVAPHKIQVIYQSCHPAFKQPTIESIQDNVRKKYHLPAQFLLSVGTIEPRKNLLTIVKSLAYHSLPLVIIGKETGYAGKVRQYIHHKKWEGRVQFLSDVSMQELAIIYRLAAVFCYLSVFEGFGIPIIESLYSQTPVITTKGGCFKEAGGPDSIYINCLDEKMLGEKINLLLQDRSLYEKVITRGWEYVQQFDDKIIATEIMKLYEEVWQNSKTSGS